MLFSKLALGDNMKSSKLILFSLLTFSQIFQMTYAEQPVASAESIQKKKVTKKELIQLKDKYKKLVAEFEIKEEKAKIKIAEIQKEADEFKEKKIGQIKSIIEKNKLQLKKLSDEIQKIESNIKDEESIELASDEDTDILVCQSQLDNESLESHIKDLIHDQEVILKKVAKESKLDKPEPIKVSKDYTSNDLVSYFSEITSQILIQNQMQMQLMSQMISQFGTSQLNNSIPTNPFASSFASPFAIDPYSINSLYLGNYINHDYSPIKSYSPFIGSTSHNLPQNSLNFANRFDILDSQKAYNNPSLSFGGYDFRPSLPQLEKVIF